LPTPVSTCFSRLFKDLEGNTCEEINEEPPRDVILCDGIPVGDIVTCAVVINGEESQNNIGQERGVNDQVEDELAVGAVVDEGYRIRHEESGVYEQKDHPNVPHLLDLVVGPDQALNRLLHSNNFILIVIQRILFRCLIELTDGLQILLLGVTVHENLIVLIDHLSHQDARSLGIRVRLLPEVVDSHLSVTALERLPRHVEGPIIGG